MAQADFDAVNGSPFQLQPMPGLDRNPAGQYGTRLDRSGWDRLFMALTGSAPGAATQQAASARLDPAIHRAAERTKDMLAADTPVDTGRMKASWEVEHEGPARYKVLNDVVDEDGTHYAQLVEARAPGGPEKYHGAMIAQNIARIEAVVAEEVDAEITILGAGR